MKNSQNKGLSTVLITAIVAILVIIVAVLVWNTTNRVTVSTHSTSTSQINWITYTNDTYGFEVRHPDTWQVKESEQAGEPRINIYKKSENQTAPFIHHNNVTNVSIFPHGVATEGLAGVTSTSSIRFNVPIKNAIDYTLENGQKFATYAGFNTVPKNWQEWGFIWSRTEVIELKTRCVVDGKTISNSICEIGSEIMDSPGAQTINSGTINEEDRQIQEQILASFKFTSGITPTPDPSTDSTGSPQATTTSRVNIYVVDLEGGGQGGSATIGCGDALAVVRRDITTNGGVLKGALTELFSLKSQYYGESGYYNALYQSNLKVDSAAVDANGKATVKLSGTAKSGGVCDDPRIVEQIKATVKQFPTVKTMDISINGRSLNTYFSQQ
jgi:hypothetical protein